MNNDYTKEKIYKCKYSSRSFKMENQTNCIFKGFDKEVIKTKEDCDNCKHFKSRFIEYPIVVNNIDIEKIDPWDHEIGSLVSISPCGDEYEGKSYLGLLLGNLPISSSVSYNKESKTLKIGTMDNPAIYVFELKKIIYGYESWWQEIDSIEDFKEITEEDIENTWYIKLLKEIANKKE